MKRSTFLMLAFGSFALVLLTFVIRGTTRLVIGDRISMILSVPVGLAALSLVCLLFVLAVLDVTGVRRMEDDLDRGRVDR